VKKTTSQPQTPPEIITKADLARLLGCDRSRITQLARAGMPVRRDGRLDRETALAWVQHKLLELRRWLASQR
jgi:phage terminase Nu1 subunit (DNA packaging protein)